MYIDFKKEVWERIRVPKNLEKQLIEKIDNEDSFEDIISWLIFDEGAESEEVYETESLVNPENNNGEATVEVFNTFGDIKYSNSKNN